VKIGAGGVRNASSVWAGFGAGRVLAGVRGSEFRVVAGFCWVVAVALGVAAVAPRQVQTAQVAQTAAQTARLAAMAVAVAAFCALAGGLAASASTAGFGCLFYQGFLVNEFGDLSWHGPGTAARWAVLGAAGLAGYAVHAALARRRRRLDAPGGGLTMVLRPRTAGSGAGPALPHTVETWRHHQP
jgi:hypothetical protein